eukprot:5692355-Amphidinium_carterae.1
MVAQQPPGFQSHLPLDFPTQNRRLEAMGGQHRVEHVPQTRVVPCSCIHWAAQGRPEIPTPKAMRGSRRLLVDTKPNSMSCSSNSHPLPP